MMVYTCVHYMFCIALCAVVRVVRSKNMPHACSIQCPCSTAQQQRLVCLLGHTVLLYSTAVSTGLERHQRFFLIVPLVLVSQPSVSVWSAFQLSLLSKTA
jgi:hypothetical protein